MNHNISPIYLEDFKDAEETFEDGTLYTTRFTTDTYYTNLQTRDSCEYTCLYGSPYKIKNLEGGSLIYMIEMNNNIDQIEGIGYLHNDQLTNPPEIYNTTYNHCNAYIYGGEYHITREEFNRLFPEILIILETKLFKGRGNQKRGKGFTKLSSNTYSENNFTEEILLSAIKETFINKYF